MKKYSEQEIDQIKQTYRSNHAIIIMHGVNGATGQHYVSFMDLQPGGENETLFDQDFDVLFSRALEKIEEYLDTKLK